MAEFEYRDRADNNITKTMTISAYEFIRRFLLHVLPHKFMKIRYFGFLSKRNKKQSITNVTWNIPTIITASLGFSFVCMIWWIYFDSFIFLIKSKFDVNGIAILYSQLLTYMSFAVLANMIRHAILNDLAIDEFRLMAILGIILLYCGKQTAYIINVPEYRYYNIRNTIVVLTIAGLSLLLPTSQYILMGMNVSMMVYIGMNYQAQIKLYGSVQM